MSINSVEERDFLQQQIKEKVQGQGQRFGLEQWWTSGFWEEGQGHWLWEDKTEGKCTQLGHLLKCIYFALQIHSLKSKLVTSSLIFD